MQPGDTFDRYSIEARIGAGGMGEVYRAYDPKLHRRVALKVLTLEGSGSQEQSERILREARAAAALDHPNAVHIYDVGEHDGRPYLAMELVEGKSLRTLVGDRSIAIEQRIRWICDVGRALSAAHRRGLVHRDVKPDNVMVRDDGSIKVLDFGIARRAQAPIDPNAPTAAGAVETLTGDGVVVGTPMYMSPEQMRGEPVDHRTDQFAWGVLAFEVLVGRLPWGARTDGVRLVAAMLSEDAPRLRSIDASIGENVDAAIARALARKRDDRFPTMSEAIAAIEGRISAVDARSTIPGASRTRRVPGWPLFAALGVAALVVGGYAMKNARDRRGPKTSPSASASSSSHGTAVTDLDVPTTAVPAAAGAYREGLQALRDGSWDMARRAFKRAAELDPSMAVAQMRWAVTAWSNYHRDESRTPWQRALLLRTALGERDRMFFDAWDVIVPRDVPDHAEHARRLTAALEKFPDDAELHVLLAMADVRLGENEAAVREFDRAIELDPMYADAWTEKPDPLLVLGRFQEAEAEMQECEKRFPASADCIWAQVWTDHWLGPCDAMEAATRRYLERDPDSYIAWTMRAHALYALGRPIESVREALDHAMGLLPEPQRAARRKEWEMELDLAEGDFAAVESIASELEPMIAGDLSERPHVASTRIRIAALLEQGRAADAAAIADAYLKHADAWTPAREVLNEWDPRLSMNHVLLLAGRLDAKTFDTMRTGLLYQLGAASPPLPPGKRWLAAWGTIAETPDEARRALDALPGLSPLPAFEFAYAADIGRTFALAERWDDAVPHLERTTNACFALEAPREVRRASWFLGLAYEAKGDAAAACRAYGDVLAHWGKAKPRSATADLARARFSALKCITP